MERSANVEHIHHEAMRRKHEATIIALADISSGEHSSYYSYDNENEFRMGQHQMFGNHE